MPVVSSSSPPSRNGAGSSSSLTATQRTGRSSPDAAARTVRPRSAMAVMSRRRGGTSGPFRPRTRGGCPIRTRISGPLAAKSRWLRPIGPLRSSHDDHQLPPRRGPPPGAPPGHRRAGPEVGRPAVPPHRRRERGRRRHPAGVRRGRRRRRDPRRRRQLAHRPGLGHRRDHGRQLGAQGRRRGAGPGGALHPHLLHGHAATTATSRSARRSTASRRAPTRSARRCSTPAPRRWRTR